MKKIILMGFLTGLIPVWSLAQSIGPSSMNNAGGAARLGSEMHEWAIGDLIAATGAGPGLIITPNSLQPAMQATAVPSGSYSAGEISVFPNPSKGEVFIQPRFSSGGSLQASLLNATGQVILQKSCTLQSGNERQSISMENLPSGVYHLQLQIIRQNQSASQSFLIQKL